VKTIIFQASEK